MQGHPGVSLMHDQCVCMLCVCVAPEGAGLVPQASAPLKGKRRRGSAHVCERQDREERGSSFRQQEWQAVFHLQPAERQTDRQGDQDWDASHLSPPNSPAVLGVSQIATCQKLSLSLFLSVIFHFHFSLIFSCFPSHISSIMHISFFPLLIP